MTIILVAATLSCNSKREEEKIDNKIHRVDSDNDSPNCTCSTQINLADSNLLIHIKGQFYKSNSGHLYERTIGVKEVNGHLVDNEYFNGNFSQEVDPLSFEQLAGWYAKDKNNAYYYRPVSGGMLLKKLDSADVKSFSLLEGHYNFASDNKHAYHEYDLLEGIDLSNLKIITDEKGFVLKLISGKTSYTPY